MPEFSMSDAIHFLETLGFAVIPKDEIKTISFHVAITDEDDKEGLTERILRSYEHRRDSSLRWQVNEAGAIKYKTRQEFNPNLTIHSWQMKVLT